MDDSKATSLKVGTILRSSNYMYCIENTLGQGSFGITYLATTRMKVKTIVSGPLGDVVQEKEEAVQVCVKEFFMKEISSRGEDTCMVEGSKSSIVQDYQRKFRKEAENLSKLKHENIVKVLEVFDANNTTYYVMEYIEGQNLDSYIPQEGLQERAALEIFRTIAKAVGYLHSQHMLHLDLKPKNVMLSNEGAVKLIDFGLSKQFDESGEPESSTNIGLGTPGYAPIEQANYRAGEGFPATLDIYALGATLYKMLTGKRPANASVINEDGLPPCPANVSVKTWNMVEWAMQPKKKDRPQSVAELLANEDSEDTENAVDIRSIHSANDYQKNIDLKIHKKTGKAIVLAFLLVIVLSFGYMVLPRGEKVKDNYYFDFAEDSVAVDSVAVDTAVVEAAIPDDFILVPGGTLKNFKDWDRQNQRYVTYDVDIDSFYVCKYELTQGDYQDVMGFIEKGNYTFTSFSSYSGSSEPFEVRGDSIPVLSTYKDFALYCNKRSAREGYDGFYVIDGDTVILKRNGNGYRLLNVYEWTFAAKGGNNHENYKYVGSNNIGEVAWYGGNSNNRPHPVGQKKPNSLGLYDMSGNIGEMLEERISDNSEIWQYEAGSEYYLWISLESDDLLFSEKCGTRIALIPKGVGNENVMLLKRHINKTINNIEEV